MPRCRPGCEKGSPWNGRRIEKAREPETAKLWSLIPAPLRLPGRNPPVVLFLFSYSHYTTAPIGAQLPVFHPSFSGSLLVRSWFSRLPKLHVGPPEPPRLACCFPALHVRMQELQDPPELLRAFIRYSELHAHGLTSLPLRRRNYAGMSVSSVLGTFAKPLGAFRNSPLANRIVSSIAWFTPR